MAKYIDAEKLIAEIKRYKNKADERLKIKGRTFSEEQKDLALQNLCGNLLHFISFLQQEQQENPDLNDLEEAARKYQEGVPVDTVIYYCGADEDVYFTNRIVDAFIAGAKWDREQMMKEAVEGLICATITGTNAISFLSPLPKELTTGDKVRIIIVKEDNHE